MQVARIAGHEDLVRFHVLVVDDGEALPGRDQTLHRLEGEEVFVRSREAGLSLLSCQLVQHASVRRERGQEVRNVAY